jgi:DNA-binding NtrC family response regulator
MSASLPRPPCVVAIDASEDVRSLYREILGDEGYGVETFDCHEATRDALRQLRPDVVLLDCFIGCDPSGWELLQVLSLDEELQMVPVVICTTDARMFGDGARESVDESISILPKPFDVQDLLSALEASLERSKLPSSNGMSYEVRR